MAAIQNGNLPRLGARKLIELRDLPIALAFLFLLPVAWFIPNRWWDSVAGALAKITAPGRRGSASRLATQVQVIMGDSSSGPAAATLEHRIVRNQIEEKLQFLREHRPGGWHPTIHVDGAEYIQAVQKQGDGCILWIAPLLFNSLLAKKALHAEGFKIIHLSRYHHGPCDSEFGCRYINSIEIQAENRYLAERPMMRIGEEGRVLRKLIKALRANQIVSIACGHYGRRTHSMPLFSGHLVVATGAPGLSLSTGAPLLPVFVQRISPVEFNIRVDKPLDRPVSNDRTEAMAELIDAYGQRLEQAIAGDPASYSKWLYLGHGRGDHVGPPTP